MITFDVTNRDFVFITNPKSGVSTTRYLLSQILQEEFQRHNRLDASLVIPHKKVAFVFRNPYKRTVSMFFRFNRVLWTDPQGQRPVVTRGILKKFGKEEGFTFGDFLAYLRITPNNERDIHYRAQDIPPQHDYLIRTDAYYEDLLAFFIRIGYERGQEKLADKTSRDVIANNVKKAVDFPRQDLSGLKTFDFEQFEKTGYPPYELLLTPEARVVIDVIFKEEIEWNRQFVA